MRWKVQSFLRFPASDEVGHWFSMLLSVPNSPKQDPAPQKPNRCEQTGIIGIPLHSIGCGHFQML